MSACGATAVINALLALEVPHRIFEVTMAVPARLRATGAPLPEYLEARSVAGTTHQDIIHGIKEVSDGRVFAR